HARTARSARRPARTGQGPAGDGPPARRNPPGSRGDARPPRVPHRRVRAAGARAVSEARELPRRIVVAGDGPLGALAAVALKLAVPTTEVVVIGLPPDPAALGERSTGGLPFAGRLHERLGIADEELVRRCGASYRLVNRYLGWGAEGHEGVAAYGAEVDPKLDTGFARNW